MDRSNARRIETDVAQRLASPIRTGARAGRRAADGLAKRAKEEGLLDVAYARVESPLGGLLVAATPRGLVRLSFPSESFGDVLAELAVSVSPRILEEPERFDSLRRQLEEYFEGARRSFEVSLDWRLSHGFRRRVLRATARIPYGETATYAEIAGSAGSARGYRAAGSALGANPIPIVVPCHRVLRTGGALGGYGGGLDVKRRLLDLEAAAY